MADRFVQLNGDSRLGRRYPIGYVIRESGCWDWVGGRHPQGYGLLKVPGTKKMVYAHRYLYEMHRGPIPDGLHIDHLCRNTSCVNPDHLETVTPGINMIRGDAIKRRREQAAARTHCNRGHPWSPENTYIQPGSGHRLCRQCIQINQIRRDKTKHREYNKIRSRLKRAALKDSPIP